VLRFWDSRCGYERSSHAGGAAAATRCRHSVLSWPFRRMEICTAWVMSTYWWPGPYHEWYGWRWHGLRCWWERRGLQLYYLLLIYHGNLVLEALYRWVQASMNC
jgi:hypothetical protein